MNEAGANELYEAERTGVPQIIGELANSSGGRCALGVLLYAAPDITLARQLFDLDAPVSACPLCGATHQTYWQGRPIRDEESLIVHFNNDHRLTFSEIARKLGPDAA